MIQKKTTATTANHAAAISLALLRGCARETRPSPLRRRQPSIWLHETQLSRDANINREFACTF